MGKLGTRRKFSWRSPLFGFAEGPYVQQAREAPGLPGRTPASEDGTWGALPAPPTRHPGPSTPSLRLPKLRLSLCERVNIYVSCLLNKFPSSLQKIQISWIFFFSFGKSPMGLGTFNFLLSNSYESLKVGVTISKRKEFTIY